jgi:hypothetical protein
MIHVPTTVRASLLSFRGSLMNPEMPVHVSHLLQLPLLITLESPSALRARRSKIIVQCGNGIGAEPGTFQLQLHSDRNHAPLPSLLTVVST